MLNCIVTGSNNYNLVKCTLDILIKFDVTHIIVATNVPCTNDICTKYKSDKIFFSNKSFLNGNEARNFALEQITSGRVLFLESGSVLTRKSIDIHISAKESQVICGLYNRLYDIECDFKDGFANKEYYKRKDNRLHLSNHNTGPWTIWRNNNISVDVKKIRYAGNFNTVFCVDGVTENALLAFDLYNSGLEFIVSQEAQIEVYTQLAETFLQQTKLERIFVWFTDKCNYQCRMCRIGQKAYLPLRYSEPTIESIKELILVAKEIGISKIELYGGEMLMRKDLFDAIELCNEYNIETSFVSNGSLITEDVAKRFVKLHVKDIPISIDAPYEELNNWIRGEHAWNRTLEGIRQLKKYGNTFSIFTVVLKQNFHYMSDMIRLARKLGAESISFQPISSRQGGKKYVDFALDYSDIPELKEEIINAFETADQLKLPIRSRAMMKTIPEYILRSEQLSLQKGCILPLHDALFTKTGKLQFCFTDFGLRKLYQKSEWLKFPDVWKSPSYQTLQKLAITGQCPGCLANCSDYKYMYNDYL